MNNNNYLKEAERIAQELLQKAKYDNGGMYWETMTSKTLPSGEYTTDWQVSDSIYSGVSGIVLFFIELAKVTKKKEYEEAVRKASKWLISYCNANPTDYYAFITGRSGVSYTLLKSSELLVDEKIKEQAVAILKDVNLFLDSKRPIDDYINGYSGTLLCLSYIYDKTKENWILNSIEAYIKKLLERTQVGQQGLYWDKSHQQVRGLCGFSHGAAGIGHVFLELGKYYNKSFYFLAKQAFEYETNLFNTEFGNWPDFRKSFFTDKDYKDAEEAYLTSNYSFFTSSGDMNAWCHGAAGVGLSRVRALEILKNDKYKEQLELAVDKTVATDLDAAGEYRTFTLCHGVCGNADLFIEAFHVTKNKKYIDYAYKIAEQVIDYQSAGKKYIPGFSFGDQEDISLFMGNAGIGYYLLRLIDTSIDSILITKLPRGNNTNISLIDYEQLSISVEEIQQKIFSKIFPKTILLLEKTKKDQYRNFLKKEHPNLKASFYDFIQEVLIDKGKEFHEMINDIYSLENNIVNIDQNTKGSAWLYTKLFVNTKRGIELLKKEDDEILKYSVVFDKDLEIHQANWNWSNFTKETNISSFKEEMEQVGFLIIPSYNGTTEWNISPLIESIIESCIQPKLIKEIVTEVSLLFDESNNEDQNKTIQQSILNQIKELIKAGILLCQ